MYLSLLELNPRSRQVRAELRDPYQMHRTLSRAFDDDQCDYKEARCLFRVDESDDGRKLVALVQSTARPNWECWTPSSDYLLSEPKLREFTPQLSDGRRLHFRLKANPTVKRDGKRIGIYTETDRLAWLQRKGTLSGFRVLEARVTSEGKQQSQTAKGFDTVFASAVFDGVLEVTDAQQFASTLESGIGSAKGFGFGLLSVAPLRK